MSLHTGDLDRAWEKLEMVIKPNGDIRALFFHDGKLVVHTRRSKGRGPIAGKIPDFIRQQMKLSAEEFRDLINCPLDRPGYIEVLKRKGLIQPSPPNPQNQSPNLGR